MHIRPLALLGVLGLYAVSEISCAANRPDIQWMRGGNGDLVKVLVYSPDGKYVASSPEVKLWRVSDGMLMRTFDVVYGGGGLAFSEDGKWLFGGDGHLLKMWGTESGGILWEIDGAGGAVSAVSYMSENGPYDDVVLAGYTDGTVKLWDPGDRGLEFKRTNLSYQVFSAGFSPQRNYFFSAGDFINGVNLWDTHSGTLVRTFTNSDFAPVALFSPDGSFMAAASSPSFSEFEPIKLWNTGSGKLLKKYSVTNWIRTLGFNRSGSVIFAGDQEGSITKWNVRSGKRLGSFPAHAGSVRALAFSPRGERFVSGGTDNAIRLWATGGRKPLRSLTEHSGPINAIAVEGRGKLAASAGADGTVRLWRTGSGKLQRVLKGHDGEVLDVAFSPDGRRLATVCDDGALRIFRTTTGRLLKTIPELRDAISGGVEFSPDGQTVVTAGFDRKLHFFDVVDGEPAGELPALGSRINALLYSPDGAQILLGGHTNAPLSQAFVAALNATNGSVAWRVDPDDNTTLCLAVSPDGGLIASGGTAQNITNGTIKLWRASDGFLVRTLESHSVEIQALCFSADGTQLISTETHAMKVWRVADGALLSTFTREIEAVGACARIPGSTSFIYGRGDGTVVRAEFFESLAE